MSRSHLFSYIFSQRVHLLHLSMPLLLILGMRTRRTHTHVRAGPHATRAVYLHPLYSHTHSHTIPPHSFPHFTLTLHSHTSLSHDANVVFSPAQSAPPFNPAYAAFLQAPSAPTSEPSAFPAVPVVDPNQVCFYVCVCLRLHVRVKETERQRATVRQRE